MDSEILKQLSEEFKKFGFFEYEARNYGKGFFVKIGDYPFQMAVLRIVILDNGKFYATLSFDIRVNNGLANYIESFRRDGQEKYIYYDETSCNHVYTINDNRMYNNADYSKWASFDSEFKNIDNFIKIFTHEAIKIIDKYLNTNNNLDYLLKRFEEERSISKARIISIIYEQLGDKINAASFLKECISQYNNEFLNNRYLAYIDFLQNGTPLPYIPSPLDKTTAIQTVGNDIYIVINKKIAKDTEILQYFGGIDSFDKPQKITYDDLNNDNGVTICKAGKWSIVRVGTDLFMNLNQEKIENMLIELSDKYNRSILFVNQDASGSFGFEVYKKGEFLRRWMAGDSEVIENIGKSITGEKKRFMDILKDGQDRQSVVDFLDDILKITYGDLEKSKTLFYAPF